MQISLWSQIGNRPMPLTSSVVNQLITNFKLYCCSKKFQMLQKNVKSLLEQLKVCIFAEIVFGVRCTLNLHNRSFASCLLPLFQLHESSCRTWFCAEIHLHKKYIFMCLNGFVQRPAKSFNQMDIQESCGRPLFKEYYFVFHMLLHELFIWAGPIVQFASPPYSNPG